jgi:hypothetical protein
MEQSGQGDETKHEQASAVHLRHETFTRWLAGDLQIVSGIIHLQRYERRSMSPTAPENDSVREQ